MKEIIEQIFVINNPGISREDWKDIKENPELWSMQGQELTLSEIKEYGETFFAVWFHIDICLTDNSCFSCIKIDENTWEIAVAEPDETIDGLNGIVQYQGTLIDVLDQFRDDYTSRFKAN